MGGWGEREEEEAGEGGEGGGRRSLFAKMRKYEWMFLVLEEDLEERKK